MFYTHTRARTYTINNMKIRYFVHDLHLKVIPISFLSVSLKRELTYEEIRFYFNFVHPKET